MELFEAEVWLGRMARLRNFETKNSLRGFRAVLFRMVPKLRRLMLMQVCLVLTPMLFSKEVVNGLQSYPSFQGLNRPRQT